MDLSCCRSRGHSRAREKALSIGLGMEDSTHMVGRERFGGMCPQQEKEEKEKLFFSE